MSTQITTSETQESIKSLIPLLSSNIKEAEDQHEYLSLRYGGFSHIESLRIAKLDSSTISRWLHDPVFSHYESMIGNREFRKAVRDDVLENVFYRNAFTVLRKDKSVLERFLGIADEDYEQVQLDGTTILKHGNPPLNDLERAYVLQIRKEYSPTQILAIRKLIDNKPEDESFSITNILKIKNLQINNK